MKTVSIFTAIMLTAALAVAWFYWQPVQAQDKEKPRAADPGKAYLELLEKRIESARKIWNGKIAAMGSPLDRVVWSRRLLDAELATPRGIQGGQPRIKACRDHLDRVRQIEKLLEQSFMVGQVSSVDVQEATYHRLDAEILLVQAGGELP